MAEGQPTWKERVEKYKKMEEQWKRSPEGEKEVIEEIIKETSIPALEAGLSAIIPLATRNKLAEHSKDVLNILFKNSSSTKPTMKKTIRAIIEAQAKHNPGHVVISAMGYLKDKNPKIVTETLKVLVENSEPLKTHLMNSVLPSAEVLFNHSTGGVREEATKLFQVLASEDPERVGEAVKSLRPIQIKEIFQEPEKKEEVVKEEEVTRIKSVSREEPVPKKRAEKVAELKQQEKEKEYVVKELPHNFYERFGSSQWKERLVIEELDELLGETGKLNRNDTYDLIDMIVKRAGESNNKVFISAMSVLAKVSTREKVQESLCVQIVKGIGKRLKDKKEQVQQSVTKAILSLLLLHKRAVLAELLYMLVGDKTLRHGVLKTLESALDHATEKDIEDAKLFKALVECTKEQSADLRALACTCISKVLAKREEAPGQGEIEEFGVERLIAVKIEAQTAELFKQKDAELTAIIESLCENIRNTSIKTEPVTPIRDTGLANDHTNITGSPIITQSLKKEKQKLPTEEMPSDNIFQEANIDCRPERRSGVSYVGGVCTIMHYVMTGVIDANTINTLINGLGNSPLVDRRILSILSAAAITEDMALLLREKLEEVTETDSQFALLLECMRNKVAKIAGEKSAFEEECLFAALCESLINGQKVPQDEIVAALNLAEKRSRILKEEEAFIIIKTAAEREYLDVLAMVERVFPISKVFAILISLAESAPVFIEAIHVLLQRSSVIPNSSVEAALNSPKFISLLERAEVPAAMHIINILKKEQIIATYSPYAKKVRRTEDITDINLLLNDIIDQNSEQSVDSLNKLEKVSVENLNTLLRSASTVVNVLLLQLNDSLSSGGTSLNVYTIIKIIKRICESDVFLSTLDAGTLLSLVSDYIVIITGQMPRGSASPDGIKKECGESLLKMCMHGPFLSMFKIYMNLLSNRYKEEKVREILVKLLWKHSKLSAAAITDRAVVTGIINRLNSFYGEFKGDVKNDALISKVLQLHLIEILKYYGNDFLKLFKVTGPVLQQVHALGGVKT